MARNSNRNNQQDTKRKPKTLKNHQKTTTKDKNMRKSNQKQNIYILKRTTIIMLDNKDATILDILEKNARTSFTQIAQKLGISEAAIRKRVKKLETKEIILGYKAHVNYKKLGFSNKIIMGVDTMPEDYFKVIGELKKYKYIKNLTTSSGDHMIMFDVWVKDMDELNEILKEVNAISGVTKSCPSIIHENIKE